MTIEERDAQVGKAIREYKQHVAAMKPLLNDVGNIGRQLESLTRVLQADSPFGVIKTRGGYVGGNDSGATVADEYRHALDADRLAKLQGDIRAHARELHRLSGELSRLDVDVATFVD